MGEKRVGEGRLPGWMVAASKDLLTEGGSGKTCWKTNKRSANQKNGLNKGMEEADYFGFSERKGSRL